jgi:cytochrome c biogenesis protein
MKSLKYNKLLQIFTDLKFAIIILIFIGIGSSLGSLIEQDETVIFYQTNYFKPIYGFIDFRFILNLGLNHVYTTWWFLSLLIILGVCLITCTLTRQFPLFKISKKYFFKKKENSFVELPFSIKLKTICYLKELIILQIQNLNFYLYQDGNLIYGYKGLIGRISPILVHLSLIIILGGSTIGASYNFKAQELLPKGEIFHFQNLIRVGWLTPFPNFTTRVNDFWVEYDNNDKETNSNAKLPNTRIHQFYSNVSILDAFGTELKYQTISVNNPLRYNNIDYYQSDWNLLGIRLEDKKYNSVYEFPFFTVPKTAKAWLTWIPSQLLKDTSETGTTSNVQLLLFDQFQNIFMCYDENGKFLSMHNVGELISNNFRILEILPATGLLIKYDPSIKIIYFGFGLLMITTCLSYLPYTQIWLFSYSRSKLKHSWCHLGCKTNRGKIQLEIDFENLIRTIENLFSFYVIKSLVKQKRLK